MNSRIHESARNIEDATDGAPLPPASETATPLTDAAIVVPFTDGTMRPNDGSVTRESEMCVPVAFARSLERRLAAATRELNRLQELIDADPHSQLSVYNQAIVRTNKAEADLLLARQQGEEMRGALKNLKEEHETRVAVFEDYKKLRAAAHAMINRQLEAKNQALQEIDLLRKRHGIELQSDPVKMDEIDAVREIYRLWGNENCQAAYQVLRQYCSTHQDLNAQWAALMVKSANDKASSAQKEVERMTFALKSIWEFEEKISQAVPECRFEMTIVGAALATPSPQGNKQTQ